MNCYIASPKDNSVLPYDLLNKDNTLFYPESKMTFHECCHTARPAHFHIVTDCPFLVSLYDRKEVFIWREGKWINPDFQTYGTCFSIIIDDIFGYQNSIPMAVIDDSRVTNCMGSKRVKL